MGQKSRYVLPDVVNPPDTVCFQIPVPNNKFHIAAFKGALFGLAKAYEWQNDTAHTALQVAAVWLEIFNNLENCEVCPVNPGYAGSSGGDEELIRQNPDNPCDIQSSVDGTTWCTFIDLSLCITPGGQPGDGTEQPPTGGGSACYHARLQGSGVWLLPAPVNTGDVIAITGATGAVNDGTLSAWRCPNGGYFFGGACLGTTTLEPTDPLNTEPHLSLICNIAGTFYPVLLGSPFTVPSGIVNEQVTFQVNDDPIADNHGDFTFDVCLTNNQAANWRSVINFKSGLHGFSLAVGTYVPGSGIQGVFVDANDATELQVALTIAASTLTSVQWTAQRPSGAGANDSDRFASATAIYGTTHNTPGTPIVVTEVHTVTGFTLLDMAMNLGTVSSSGLFLEELIIEGSGVKPSNLP